MDYVMIRPDSESNIHYIFFDHSSFTEPVALTLRFEKRKSLG